MKPASLRKVVIRACNICSACLRRVGADRYCGAKFSDSVFPLCSDLEDLMNDLHSRIGLIFIDGTTTMAFENKQLVERV